MPNSGTVTAGSAALASQYNNLRDDVLNITTGHTHTGASENGAKVEGTALKATGITDGYVLTADGSNGVAWEAIAAAGADVQEFTSSGSWVKPAGKSAVYVLAVGGGGGGASGDNSDSAAATLGGNGGGGAAHAARWLVASTLAGTITVTVGAAGTGGTAAAASASNENGVAGASGGNSSFGTVVLALGGLGGDRSVNGQHPSARGGAEWGQRLNSVSQGGTSDNPATAKNFDQTDPINLSFALAAGRSGFVISSGNFAAVRAMTRTGGGGSGGGFSGSALNGSAGGRGFGFDGAIANGGTAGGGAGTAAAAALGCGGGGGGCIQNGTAGAGAAGYLGGGGGGGGGVYRTSGSAQGGAGGAGGGGYILVISV